MLTDIKNDSKLKSGVNLIVIQLGLYALPLVTIPYTVKTVGIENYGKYAFFQAVAGLLSVVAGYGFVQTGVRDISMSEDLKCLNSEYSAVMFSKLMALAFSVIIALPLLFLRRFSSEPELFMYSLLTLVAVFLDTSFVYQGIEKLKDFVHMSLVGNIVVIVLLFALVRDESGYRLLPLVFTLPRVTAYLASIALLRVRFNISLSLPGFRTVLKKMRVNFNFFVSNIFIILYTRATAVFLGVFAGDAAVGYYSLADQLTYAYSNIQGKVSTVYQPQTMQAFSDSLSKGREAARESIFAVSIMALSGFLFTQFFTEEILTVFFSTEALPAVLPLRLLSLNFITIHISSILGMQVLLAMYRDKEILRPSVYAALLNATLGCAAIYLWGATGAAASVAAIECLILVYFIKKVRDCGVELLDKRLVARVFEFVLPLLGALSVLRLSYSATGFSPYVKLPVTVAAYGVAVIGTLVILGMIDVRGRRLLVERMTAK
ncbi:MAG: hypothetical protein A2X99_08955 [Deltaproteobacteria bacterium GWB2_55_19]|nr:MAG: hypothetical protein A2X99_08955 [Deltaproteobacteria bacterium GWB2_55_19]HAO92845.1 hypothetical protein [Deltaproteobacteria bacterium]